MSEEGFVPWAKIDVDIYFNPKIRAAGALLRERGFRGGWAREVFQYFLLIRQKHELQDVVPAKHCSIRVIADAIDCTPSECNAAIDACVHKDVRLLERLRGGDHRIVGYTAEWMPRPMSNSERQDNWRKRQDSEVTDRNAPVTPRYAPVTTCNDSLPDLESERDPEKIPPNPPKGGTSVEVENDKPKRKRPKRGEYSPEIQALTAEYLVWFNRRFNARYELDGAENQQLVAALVEHSKGKWGFREMRVVSEFWGARWQTDEVMQAQVCPSAMLRKTKFATKLEMAQREQHGSIAHGQPSDVASKLLRNPDVQKAFAQAGIPIPGRLPAKPSQGAPGASREAKQPAEADSDDDIPEDKPVTPASQRVGQISGGGILSVITGGRGRS